MYTYALDESAKKLDEQPSQTGQVDGRAGLEGSKYTMLSISLPNCELTWCLGPGISTIFITKDEFPQDLWVLSRGHFP